MNDRFRFRTPIYGADGKFKKFVYWPAVYGAPAVTCREGDVFGQPEQCTGLKDKHGRLIYEGDIVSVTGDVMTIPSFLEGKLAKVIWEINCFSFYFPHPKKSYFCECWDYEILGNIHENPELLEAEMNKQKFKVLQDVWWPRKNFGVLSCKVIAAYEMGRQDRITYEVAYFDDYLKEVCVGTTSEHFLYATEEEATKAWEEKSEKPILLEAQNGDN